MTTKPILQGVRVLDLTRVVAGPWCTQTLGDLGAEEIKIERPGLGDDTRRVGPYVGTPTERGGDSAFFLGNNRNKLSATIDISKPAGQKLIAGEPQCISLLQLQSIAQPRNQEIHCLGPKGQQRPGDNVVISLGHHAHGNPVPLLQCACSGYLLHCDRGSIRQQIA